MKEQLKIDFNKIQEVSNFSDIDIEIKKSYLNKFIENGFPNRKQENWKFLDINQIISNNISDLSFYNDYSIENKIDSSIFIDDLEHNKIIFINGRIEKIDFSYEDKKQIEIIEDSYTIDKSENNNSLIDLNIALSNKHSKILIKKGYSFKKPLIIYHLTNEKMKSKNINLRLDFELEQNSTLKLIDFFSDDSEKNFMNIFYNFNLDKDAILKNYKIDKSLNGRIYVDSKAQKTDGYQLSKAILLDETSEFNAKPELEIYADDVKCSHGSASGSLDDNSIFYLMSRGLNYKQAKGLLINGFLLDVIEKITDAEIKDLLKKMIGLKK